MTYEEIKPYIERKLVTEQFHPEDQNVIILNYTPECQFSGAWDEVTRQCRGLIMNIVTGEILARPFPKFFNYGEFLEKGWPIPTEVPIVTEKYDGSLGILYRLNGKSRVATRGSFISDQALWATAWLNEYCGELSFDSTLTYLFEIVYPANKIVVKYDFSGLVLLAAIDTAAGVERKPVIVSLEKPMLRYRRQIPTTNLTALSKLDEPNSEGFVVFFPVANVRMKIKFPEYVRLHKIVTGLSSIGIWESLFEGNELDIKDIPDELFKWIEEVKTDLKGKYVSIEEDALRQYEKIVITCPQTRKEWAEGIMKMTNPSIGFTMLAGKDYSKIRWNMTRPSGKSIDKTDIDL